MKLETSASGVKQVLLTSDPCGTLLAWRAVLDYSLDGNLQATLDEYVHVLPE